MRLLYTTLCLLVLLPHLRVYEYYIIIATFPETKQVYIYNYNSLIIECDY